MTIDGPTEQVAPDFWSSITDVGDPFRVFDEIAGGAATWVDGTEADVRYANGFWLLRSADDIRQALHDTGTFSSSTQPADSSIGRPGIPINIDPPAHGLYRRPLAALFSPPIVTRLRAYIEDSARRIIDPLVERRGCDFVVDFARPFPTRVYTGMLGVDDSDVEQLVTWTQTILHAPTAEARRTAAEASVAYLDALVTERMRGPRDDVLSSIVKLTVDNRPISHDEALRTAYLLMIAGLDTVTAALSFSMWYLAEHDEHRRLIAHNADVVSSAVDELLRRNSFVNAVRLCTRDVAFAGVQMRTGEMVVMPTTIVSRDPEMFPLPKNVDIERTNAHRHYAFGAGPHRCLGAHLAKEQMRVALTEWHHLIPDYHIPEGTAPDAFADTIMGVRSLTLAW